METGSTLGDTLFSTVREIANFGETFIDPLIPENTRGVPLSFEAFQFGADRLITPFLVSGIVGVVFPLYSTLYLAPELLYDDVGQGLNLPWKPFEYANVLLDIVEPVREVGKDLVWASAP